MSDYSRANRRVGVLLAGLLLASAWVIGAAVSGRLSPAARRPILDGTVAIQPYRWVDPPPDLAAGNQPPAAGDFKLGLTDLGTKPNVLTTGDGQVSVFLDRGAFGESPSQTDVRLSVQPIAPSAVAKPPGALVVFGNVVRIAASYEPSGQPAAPPAPIQVLLVYPVTPGLASTSHRVIWSGDGRTWKVAAHGSDVRGTQQAYGRIEAAGYVAVTGMPATPAQAPGGGGGTSLELIITLVTGCLILVGLGILARGRRGDAEIVRALAELDDDSGVTDDDSGDSDRDPGAPE